MNSTITPSATLHRRYFQYLNSWAEHYHSCQYVKSATMAVVPIETPVSSQRSALHIGKAEQIVLQSVGLDCSLDGSNLPTASNVKALVLSVYTKIR